MNQKVKGILRTASIEDAQTLWSAMDSVGVATESFVRATSVEHHHPAVAAQSPLDASEEMALQELARAVHHAKACFARATGWYPVSIYVDKLQDGVGMGHLSQPALDGILRGAVHFDVMVEAFTFRYPELQQQAVDQAYEELLATEPQLRTCGSWAEDILHRACADAIARLYGSKSITSVLNAQQHSSGTVSPTADSNVFGDRQ